MGEMLFKMTGVLETEWGVPVAFIMASCFWDYGN
jgi:hypothetical protein